MKKIFIFMCMMLICMLVFACTPNGNAAADGTLAYLEALAKKDKNAVVSLTCKAWEDQAILEVDALMSVGSELKEVNCREVGQEGDVVMVVCSGNLNLTYNDEIRSIDLSKRTYSMVMEDGQWRMCSYQ